MAAVADWKHFEKTWQDMAGVGVPEYEEETLRELFENPYRIVYQIADQQIDVVAVVHAVRRLPRGLGADA